MVKKSLQKDIPGDIQLVQLAVAATRHAAQQHADALALLDHGRWPTAFSVAALGLEEMGKSFLCMTALTFPPTARVVEAATFWKLFNHHQAKAALAHLSLSVYVSTRPPPTISRLWAEAAAAADEINATKFRGLYVDVAEDGVLLEPAEVAEAQARTMVSLLGDLLQGLRSLGVSLEDLDDPADFVDFLHQWDGAATFYTALTTGPEAKIEAFVDQLIAAMRGTLRDHDEDAERLLEQLLPPPLAAGRIAIAPTEPAA